MRVTKLGHCCLLIEEQGLRVLTDPGSYSTAQNKTDRIDIVLITHEHPDHLHIDSLKIVLKNNPQAQVFTNSAVGKHLDKESIAYRLLEDGQKISVQGVLIEAHGNEHAYIYDTVPAVQNTGFFIAEKLFYPGDSFYNPKKEVYALALPVAGPWLKLAESINYAKEINPRLCFPVHDGMIYKDNRIGPIHRLPESSLAAVGIRFIPMKDGDVQDF